jgi:hypothetical protein
MPLLYSSADNSSYDNPYKLELNFTKLNFSYGTPSLLAHRSISTRLAVSQHASQYLNTPRNSADP